jgi:hypothetical protein
MTKPFYLFYIVVRKIACRTLLTKLSRRTTSTGTMSPCAPPSVRPALLSDTCGGDESQWAKKYPLKIEKEGLLGILRSQTCAAMRVVEHDAFRERVGFHRPLVHHPLDGLNLRQSVKQAEPQSGY